jgi:hypothetical protein
MNGYGKLYVGDEPLASYSRRVDPELLSVFTDSMYRSRIADAAGFHVNTKPGATVSVHEFTGRGRIIADRLDILGFTPDKVYRAIDIGLDKARADCLPKDPDPESDYYYEVRGYYAEPDPDYAARIERDKAYLDGYTAQDWITDLRGAQARHGLGSIALGSVNWLRSRISTEDVRLELRAFLLARPDDEVRLDVTELVTGGWLDDGLAGICTSGLAAMRAVAAAHAPIVVLTEGKTDIAVLQPAFRLLHPHLDDLVRFMDYGERPPGGAGPLVSTVRSFAAAGIANRVVALFDNDTAATDALRSLDRTRLPDNIRVHQYPPLDLARHYPTLGPPPADSGVAYADVNGLAGSIEMYLGRDILTLPDKTFRPVQWTTYIPGARQYQGEITSKQALHNAYRAKIRNAETNPSSVAQQDWSGIHAIFEVVLQAFRSDTATNQQP